MKPLWQKIDVLKSVTDNIVKWVKNMFLRFVISLIFSLLASISHAGIFDDDEARKAILDLRQQIVVINNNHLSLKSALLTSQQSNNEEVSALRRSILDLQNQIDKQKNEIALLRGENEQNEEQIKRSLSDLQKKSSEIQNQQSALVQTTEKRLAQIEPVKVQIDGREFMAEPAEKREYESALQSFRAGDYAKAEKSFKDVLIKYPTSGYASSALFWLGSSQYFARNYKEAIVSFRALVAKDPDHLNAPESMLSIANCQIELKDSKSAKSTLSDLQKKYPKSDAAAAAVERLVQIK